MKILFFAGSLRKESCNKKFVRAAMKMAQGSPGAECEYLDLKDYPMPPYDGDIEAESGIPEETKRLGDRIRAADALIISTPEYNGSIPGVLKNVIDWLSREKPVSLEGKQMLLIAASPGALGGVRSLWHSRVPFEVVGAHVFPTMMGLPNAYNVLDGEGNIKEEKPRKQLEKLIGDYIAYLGG